MVCQVSGFKAMHLWLIRGMINGSSRKRDRGKCKKRGEFKEERERERGGGIKEKERRR